MGLFDRIKEKLGFGHDSSEAHKQASTPPANATATSAEGATLGADRPTATTNATITPAAAPAMSQVDVAVKLDGMAATHPETLNWRTSIVDLLKLLGLDSSLTARKELATELGCPQDKMTDSGTMNIWLHKTVMQKLAEHGGSIPPELLH
ncbi:DUF3597 domain-containing protein [Stutzerimonas stutzeri]|uniref:DUF3597 domain-containing protein n=1 Tax=Stutzerimonas sp. S1 TaxID=3030652 RepID=UPI0022249099|nr:DUF3597 domain-containing protein [Stutzerimonas sp. S1]MCW3149011.1 DUF3597 domain-containing protein [Stutzerimonas sp. S1]